MILTLSPRQRACCGVDLLRQQITCLFSVTLRRWSAELAIEIGKRLERAALQQNRGHNGIAAAAGDRLFGAPDKCVTFPLANWAEEA